MPAHIRAYRSSDAEVLLKIYAYYIANETVTFDLDPPSLEAWQGKLDGLVATGHPVLVLEDSETGKLVGYAYCAPYRPKPAYRFTVENTIYVDPTCQRQGHGATLMEALIDAAIAADFRQMVAVITSSAAASVKIHENFGFSLIGAFPSVGYKHGKWLSTIYMLRPLGASDTTPPEIPN